MFQGIINGGALKYKVPKELDTSIPQPNGPLILIRMLDLVDKTTTKSGLVIEVPDEDREELENSMTIGYVQALGDLCYTHEKFKGNPWCKQGDYILFGRMQGIDIEFNKQRYKFLMDDKPLLTFSEQQLIDFDILER